MTPRVLFYIKRSLHLPHLEPILRWMRENVPAADVRVSAPPYSPSFEGTPGVGLTAAQIDQLRDRGLTWLDSNAIGDWSPQATVMADADYGAITWGGALVNANHGLISKGWYYTNRPGVQRDNTADLVLVPGDHHAQVIRPLLRVPVVATGLVKFDAVGRSELTRESARKELGVPESAGVVCFAPTFNTELSAVPVLADRVRELTADGRHVLVKLHGMAPLAWVELYRLLARLEERVHFVDSVDLIPSLMAADVVISDVSSAFMEAIALNRPVVLVDNPLQRSYYNYDPNDIEYRWRDVGVRAATADETLAAVDRCFQHPAEKEPLRRDYGRRLVGEVDGRASERAALAILTLIGWEPGLSDSYPG